MSLPIVSAQEIARRVEAAGGDTAILREAGFSRTTFGPVTPLIERAHEHSCRRWEQRRDCLGCRDLSRSYYRERSRR